MKQVFIVKEGNPNLTVFFAGWGADETPFKEYRPTDNDYLICYDYRNLDFDFNLIKGYKYVTIVAWSMGVWAASQVMGRYLHEEKEVEESILYSHRVAYNGTPYPIDDELGIPTETYHKMTKELSEATLSVFLRKMCGTADAYREFLKVSPRRPLEELREELVCIEKQDASLKRYPFPWSKAVISTEDSIIPPPNQWLTWISEGIMEDKGKEDAIFYTDEVDFTAQRTASPHYDALQLQYLIENG